VLKHPDELTGTQATELQGQWMQARYSSLGAPAVLSGGITFETLPFGPVTTTDSGLISTFTLSGRGIGFFPIRDISLVLSKYCREARRQIPACELPYRS